MRLLHNFHRISKKWLVMAVIVSVVFVNEWLSYVVKAANWPVIPSSQGESVRILIAADPQILSLQSDSEPAFPVNLVTIWDADRFVSRGFHLALWKAKPDIVIFLGDLLNDGSIFNDGDFNSTLRHFKQLLHIPKYVKHTIFVPGDNDIGGEGMDLVTDHKVRRFFSFFNQSTTLRFKFLDFIQIRVMDDYDIATGTLPKEDGRIRILLSHMPLLTKTRTKLKEKILEQHPSFIFSGHEHQSFHFAGAKSDARVETFEVLQEEQNVWEFEGNGDRLHEVTVPTCSYRMGKKAMGFGLAVIDLSGRVQYTVLWLPSRFKQLWLYLTTLGLICLIFIFNILHSLRKILLRCLKFSVLIILKGIPKYHGL